MKKIILLICIIIVTSLSCCIENHKDKQVDNEKQNINFELKIHQEREMHYNLSVPMANISSIDYQYILDKIVIEKGDCTLSIIHTEKGIALNILSISMNSQLTFSIQSDNDFHLTMKHNYTNPNDDNYWAYRESLTNGTIEISYSLGNDNTFTSGYIFSSEPAFQCINNGWNVITIKGEGWDV